MPKKNRKSRRQKNPGRRNRRTGNRNPIRLNIGRGTSALGPMYRTQMVTQFVTGALDELVRIPLYDLLTSVEFSSVALFWRYFKLQAITVTVYPNNNNTTSSPAYLLLNWGDGSVPNIRLDNNAKIIPAYRTRFYSYTWTAPSMENDGYTINKYHPTDEAALFPGAISIHAPSNIDSWTIRLDAKVKFKGSRVDSQTKNNDMETSHYKVDKGELLKEQMNIINKIKQIYKLGNEITYNGDNLNDINKVSCKCVNIKPVDEHLSGDYDTGSMISEVNQQISTPLNYHEVAVKEKEKENSRLDLLVDCDLQIQRMNTY